MAFFTKLGEAVFRFCKKMKKDQSEKLRQAGRQFPAFLISCRKTGPCGRPLAGAISLSCESVKKQDSERMTAGLKVHSYQNMKSVKALYVRGATEGIL